MVGKADVNCINDILLQGHKDKFIAVSCNCSIRTVERIRQKAGIPKNGRKIKINTGVAEKSIIASVESVPNILMLKVDGRWTDMVAKSMCVLAANGRKVDDEYPLIYIDGVQVPSFKIVEMANDALAKRNDRKYINNKERGAFYD